MTKWSSVTILVSRGSSNPFFVSSLNTYHGSHRSCGGGGGLVNGTS
jgi:hypothetical protein